MFILITEVIFSKELASWFYLCCHHHNHHHHQNHHHHHHHHHHRNHRHHHQNHHCLISKESASWPSLLHCSPQSSHSYEVQEVIARLHHCTSAGSLVQMYNVGTLVHQCWYLAAPLLVRWCTIAGTLVEVHHCNFQRMSQTPCYHVGAAHCNYCNCWRMSQT